MRPPKFTFFLNFKLNQKKRGLKGISAKKNFKIICKLPITTEGWVGLWHFVKKQVAKINISKFVYVQSCGLTWRTFQKNCEILIKTEGVVGFSKKWRQIPMKTEWGERFLILLYIPTDRRKAMTIGLLASRPKNKF